jgi:CubicO group peptidase (beta-lactamase class C family)
LFSLIVTSALVLLVAPHGVSAAGTEPGHAPKPDEFIKKWLVLKSLPVPSDAQKTPTDEDQKRAFAQNWLATTGGEAGTKPTAGMQVTIDNKQFVWRAVTSTNDTVDLREGSDPAEFAIAYAWTEVTMKKPTRAVLGIGSDDSVKLWVNGKLVHENWISRGTRADDDIVPVALVAGKNCLLFKIQNGVGPWGLTCRVMGPNSQAQKLITTTWNSGDVEELQRLLDLGLDINSRTRSGLTPWLAARLKGQAELAQFLAGKGADCSAKMPPTRKMVDSLFENTIKPGGPGAAVLVARDGKVLFQKGYGLADVEHGLPVTARTKFRIGSISKQFTAAAILKLQEQGKLSVEDKLSKYYPDYLRGDEVTLRHLLTHTSGIHSYTDKPGFMDSVTKPVKPDVLVESFKKDPFDFDPGKRWSYCNSGYFLLGCIVEKVSGQSYEDFLRKSFFKPLGMKNTGVHHCDLELKNVALGYDGSPKRAVNWDMTWAGGAGALYSTVGDLYRWNEALFHGKVLTAATLEAAFKPVKTSANQDDGSEAGYGFGWGISKFRGASEIAHGGGLNGFTSYLLRLPDKNLTVTVMANGAPNTVPQSLARTTAEFCLGSELEARPKAVKVPGSALDLLAGRYDYGQAVLIVQREGSRLFAQLGLQPRHEIFPKSENEFFWKVVDAQVAFVKGTDGRIVEAVHRQSGATIHAPRLADLKVAEVDPTAYEALVGKYKIDNTELIATVTQEDKRLFGQMPGQPRLELLPLSEREFGLREVNARLTFIKDDSGKVIKAKVLQAGQTTEGRKIE